MYRLDSPLHLHWIFFRTFKNDKKHNLEYLVIELSSHGGYYKRTDGLDFDIIVFTNLTQDSLGLSSYIGALQKHETWVRCKFKKAKKESTNHHKHR